MTPHGDAEPYARVLRRGRVTLFTITLLIAVSEIGIIATILSRRGSQSVWQLGFGALLSVVLLRALYRGYDLARWLTVALLALLFVLLMIAAVSRGEMGAGMRLVSAFVAGMYAGLAIVLLRSRPVGEFMARAMLRRVYAGRLFSKDGIQLYEGKSMEEWIPLAASPNAADRLEAVKGLRRVLEEVESSECERALLCLAQDREEPVRYEAVSALRFGKDLIRHERPLAVEVLREIRSQPLPEGVALFIDAEDPYTIEEHFDHDPVRLEAAARFYHVFQYSGEVLRSLGVDPNLAPGPSAKSDG